MFPATGSTITAVSDSIAEAGECLAHTAGVVEIQGHRVPRESGGDAGRGRHSEGERTGARLHEQRVGVSVVATLELHDGVPAGESAGEPDGAQRRLGAGAHHAHLVHRGHECAYALGHLRLEHRGRAEAQAGTILPLRAPPRPPGDAHDRRPPVPMCRHSRRSAWSRCRAARPRSGTRSQSRRG